MDPITQQQYFAAAGSATSSAAVEDLFATQLYSGNGSTQTITNGIDLAGEGGLVWTKVRNNSDHHSLTDTDRGTTSRIKANHGAAANTVTNSITSFNSNGFSLGNSGQVNANGYNFVSWSFIKHPDFFDIVEYTGDGSTGRTVSHSLNKAPGMIIIKNLSSTYDWAVYFKSLGNDHYFNLNENYGQSNNDSGNSNSRYWNQTSPTSTEFTLGNDSAVNADSSDYIAYLFAEDESDLIKQSTYTGNGTTNNVNVGFEPQFVLIKNGTTGNWNILDDERGDNRLQANQMGSEATDTGWGGFSSTGFSLTNAASDYNSSSGTYHYMAIAKPST